MASGSFASLRENVKYYNSPNYAILVRTTDFKNKFTKDLIYTDKLGYEFLSNSNLHGGELILPNIGASIGKVFLMPCLGVPMTLAPNSIMVKCWDEISVKWLYYFFLSEIGQAILSEISSSTAQGKFNKTDFRNVEILLPPLLEQERIITQIETTFSVLEFLEDSKAKIHSIAKAAKSKILDLAMQGKLVPQDPSDESAVDMLRRVNPKAEIIRDNPHYGKLPDNWVWVKVRDVFSPMKRDLPKSEYFSYIDIDSVDNKTNTVKPKNLLSKDAPSRASRFTQKGDVVFSMVRPYLRNIAMVPFDACIASTGFYVFSPTYAVNKEYAFKMILSPYFVDGLNTFMKGDNSPSITKDNVDEFIIPIPPLEEQQRIVAKIEELYSILDEIEASLQT